jgi:hypothetical protein
MDNEMIIKGQGNRTRNKGYVLSGKYNIEDPDRLKVKRQLFLAMLKKRYGYSNDKAVDELQRLLTQFYRTNKSLGIRHP